MPLYYRFLKEDVAVRVSLCDFLILQAEVISAFYFELIPYSSTSRAARNAS